VALLWSLQISPADFREVRIAVGISYLSSRPQGMVEHYHLFF